MGAEQGSGLVEVPMDEKEVVCGLGLETAREAEGQPCMCI